MSGNVSVPLLCVLRRRRHSSSVQLSSHQILWWSRAALKFTWFLLQLKKSIFCVKLSMTCFSLVLVFSSGCMGQHGALDVVFCRLFCNLAKYSYSTGYVGPGECKYTHTPAHVCDFSLTSCLWLPSGAWMTCSLGVLCENYGRPSHFAVFLHLPYSHPSPRLLRPSLEVLTQAGGLVCASLQMCVCVCVCVFEWGILQRGFLPCPHSGSVP